MSDAIIKERLQKVIFECERHIQRLQSAYKKMAPFMPLDKKRLENLDDDAIEHIDQFLFRFAKLQDAMGQKLFKRALLCLGEEVENKPFIDILHLMEKLGLIEDANEWKKLRIARNELAHNYEDDPQTMAETINRLYRVQERLIQIYFHIKNYLLQKKCLGE